MKIKVFTTDKDGKICLSKDELQEIINEAYWEGYCNGAKSGKTWTISTPWTTTPYYNWSTTTNGSSSITIGADDITEDSICINTSESNNINLNNYSNKTNMKVSY